MRKLFKILIKSYLYCLSYVCIINISSSAINNTLETLNQHEIISINGMISGQKDVITFIEFEINNIDFENFKDDVIFELKNF